MENETPKTYIVRGLRLIWLRSRERAAALKRDGYSCQMCKVKQSKRKGMEQRIEVHHIKGVGNWNRVIEVIREEILCDPEKLQTLCPECHRWEA